MKDIKRIVLTGGPCAGKTTALVRIIYASALYNIKITYKYDEVFDKFLEVTQKEKIG